MEKPHNHWVYAVSRWRRGRDSNPREIALKLISSQPRYDHFDTSPYIRPRFREMNAYSAFLPEPTFPIDLIIIPHRYAFFNPFSKIFLLPFVLIIVHKLSHPSKITEWALAGMGNCRVNRSLNYDRLPCKWQQIFCFNFNQISIFIVYDYFYIWTILK